jgi:hypothetical protein
VHRLVEVGTWDAVEADVSPQLTRELRGFQAHIRRDGIKRASIAGVLHHDCPPASAVAAGKDCFVHVVSGRQVVPIGGVRKLRARFRLWVESTDRDSWQVINYDFDVLTR